MANKVEIHHDGAIVFHCPACGCSHSFYARPDRSPHNGASWEWNFNKEAPTFRPSLLVRSHFTDRTKEPKICHSFVTDGNIEYLQDCTHKLAGQTVQIPDYDD